MAQKFTTPCFIRKNTVELRKKLEELGYKTLNSGDTTLDAHNFDGRGHHKHINEGTAIITSYGGYYGVVYEVDNVVMDGRIDCGTNDDLFLSLAALREDSDYMQFFTNGTHWYICEANRIENSSLFDKEYKVQIKDGSDYHKATAGELIEHFKN